jgi:hypothetical protein
MYQQPVLSLPRRKPEERKVGTTQGAVLPNWKVPVKTRKQQVPQKITADIGVFLRRRVRPPSLKLRWVKVKM